MPDVERNTGHLRLHLPLHRMSQVGHQWALLFDTAISNHIANTFPGYYTEGWIIITVSATLDNPRGKNYRILTPDTQPFHADSGLLEVGKLILNDQWCSTDDEDEDGE